MHHEPDDIEQELRIAQLISKHFNATLTEDEQLYLNSWLNQRPENKVLFEKFITAKEIDNSSINRYDAVAGMTAIEEKIKKADRRLLIRRWVAAATIIPALAIVTMFLLNRQKAVKQGDINSQIVTEDELLPKRSYATLKTDKGITVNLESNRDTMFGFGTMMLNEKEGTLVLSANNGDVPEYQTLETRRGTEYKLILSDGSTVWLNAASSIRFPSKFAGKERRVQVTGEVFFEVTHNEQMPFIVEANEVAVQVLGTSFNVNTYEPEKSITTLVTGRVQLKHRAVEQVLKPGESGFVSGNKITVAAADIETVTGWKNGAFIQRNAGLRSIMQEVSRWYDVDIVYQEGFVNTAKTTIDVSRKVPLGKLLEIIALSTSENIRYSDGKVYITKPE